MYGFNIAACVDDDNIVAKLGKFEESRSYFFMVCGGLKLHPVKAAFHSLSCGFQIDVENNRQVGPDSFERMGRDVENFCDSYSAGKTLICAGARKPAVEQDAVFLFQRRCDTFTPELRAAGHIKQQLRPVIEYISAVEEDFSDFLAGIG